MGGPGLNRGLLLYALNMSDPQPPFRHTANETSIRQPDGDPKDYEEIYDTEKGPKERTDRPTGKSWQD